MPVNVSNNMKLEVMLMKHQMSKLLEEMKEIKESQKDLVEFMYRQKGGTAWLFGLLAAAAALGGLISAVADLLIKAKIT